jgi:hypothetical protein
MIIRLYSVSGYLVGKNVSRYRIKWDERSRSNLQFRVKQLLKPIWQGDIVFEEFPVFGTKLRVDIFNATKKIAVEANGPQHDKYNKFFHDGSSFNFLAGVMRDTKKQDWLERNGIRLVEYVEADLKDVAAFYKRLYGNP